MLNTSSTNSRIGQSFSSVRRDRHNQSVNTTIDSNNDPHEEGRPIRHFDSMTNDVVMQSVTSQEIQPAAADANGENAAAEQQPGQPSEENANPSPASVPSSNNNNNEHTAASGPPPPPAAADDDPESANCYCGAVSGNCPSFGTHVNLIQQNNMKFKIIFVALFVVNFIFHITTYGGCACVQPISFTTWAGRASQERWCEEGKPCWAYHLVGQNCSSLNSVVHWVEETAGDISADAISVKVCLGGPHAITEMKNCTQPTGITHVSALQKHYPIPDDTRYLLHVSTEGLDGDTIYTFLYSFKAGSEVTRVVRTLPCGQSKNISFIGGGDYHTSSLGAGLVDTAMKHSNSSAYFLFIGGDLSYSNNMRFCHRRVDKFLSQVTNVQRHDGGYLPMLVAVGNHEGGGYGHFSSKQDREEGFFFHPQYFPSFHDFTDGGTTAAASSNMSSSDDSSASAVLYQDADHTTTYHRHIIGGTGWIVLDSGIIFTIDEQLKWFNESISYYSTLINAGELSKIIVTYHNPAYPSVREFEDTHTAAVREKVVPIMETHWPKIPWVLENHDHAYKRTFPLYGGEVHKRANSSVSAGQGIVYTGDGALGVADFTRTVEHRWYHEETQKGNYAMSATLLSSADPLKRVAHVNILGEDGKSIDEFFV